MYITVVYCVICLVVSRILCLYLSVVRDPNGVFYDIVGHISRTASVLAL